MELHLNPKSIEDYQTFLDVKALPKYSVRGRTVIFPDEYADRIGKRKPKAKSVKYKAWQGMFDYQADIAHMAIKKQKFAIFADCGLGKTRMMLEFARHALQSITKRQKVLIVSPLMVVGQTIDECHKVYGDALQLERVTASEISAWMTSKGSRFGITNYEALKPETPQGNLGALILDESSMLKSHYGAWGTQCIRLGSGLDWKLAATGTPAPNDRIEFANHAVFLDAFPTVNSFLARFFVNRGQTDNRWELKAHALESFYVALSHWSIFLTDPSVYGWKSNTEPLPPINVHFHDVPLTQQQTELAYDHTGALFADQAGGITSRSVLSQIAKGNYKGKNIPTNKTAYIRSLVDSWPDESTIIWCLYNREQDIIYSQFPDAANIDGSTPIEKREEYITDFKAGRRKVLISKPKVLGFGLNLQIATRQIFSGLQDSYESYYQAVKRSNRYGSKYPLNVHIPYTDIEKPMIDTVMNKADRVETDTIKQQEIFSHAYSKAN